MGTLTNADGAPCPVSAQGRAVLQALTAAVEGRLSPADVLRRVQRPGASVAVTRASLSRTLRRLWTAGLVELADGAARTLTGEADQQRRWAEIAAAQPETAYRAYLDKMRQDGQPDRYGSAGRYVAAWQEVAARMPTLRVRLVHVTGAGRAALRPSA